MYKETNPNPCGRRVGDCAVRAIAVALGITWEAAYITLALNGLKMCDVMNADSVIAATLRQHGFTRRSLSETCPECYTVEDFCREFPFGTFVVFFGGHVACIKDGVLMDAWDSSNELIQYYWASEGSV